MGWTRALAAMFAVLAFTGCATALSVEHAEDRVLSVEPREETMTRYEVVLRRGERAGDQVELFVEATQVQEQTPFERQTVDRTIVRTGPPRNDMQKLLYGYGAVGTVVCGAILLSGILWARPETGFPARGGGEDLGQTTAFFTMLGSCVGVPVLGYSAVKDIQRSRQERDHLGRLIIDKPVGERVAQRRPAAKLKLSVRGETKSPECRRAPEINIETDDQGGATVQVPAACASDYAVWVGTERAASVAVR
jgi:hypothetical protein